MDGNRVFTESKFSGGRKAKNATVEVYDSGGNKLLEGKTDDNEDFDFKIPKKTELKVVLIAGMEHRGEWTIPLDEIAPEASPHAISDTPAEIESKKTDDSIQPTQLSGPNTEEIPSVVETVLDKKLKPLIKMMAESKQNKSIEINRGGWYCSRGFLINTCAVSNVNFI